MQPLAVSVSVALFKKMVTPGPETPAGNDGFTTLLNQRVLPAGIGVPLNPAARDVMPLVHGSAIAVPRAARTRRARARPALFVRYIIETPYVERTAVASSRTMLGERRAIPRRVITIFV